MTNIWLQHFTKENDGNDSFFNYKETILGHFKKLIQHNNINLGNQEVYLFSILYLTEKLRETSPQTSSVMINNINLHIDSSEELAFIANQVNQDIYDVSWLSSLSSEDARNLSEIVDICLNDIQAGLLLEKELGWTEDGAYKMSVCLLMEQVLLLSINESVYHHVACMKYLNKVFHENS